MKPATLERSYYPSLDGLRGIAIILVICCHNLDFIPYLQFGWVGVDLFFVLSGFLISDILIRTKENKHFLKHFYIRRILRIFPLYYLVVLVFFIVAPLVGQLHEQYVYYHQNQELTWFHFQNWLYITKEKPSDFLLLNHFWSLSVEEQFYLLWPLAIFSIKSYKKLVNIAFFLLAICIAFRFCSWLYYGVGYTSFYFQYMTRFDGLCIGSVIAIWKFADFRSFHKKVLRMAVVLLGCHLFVFLLSRTLFKTLPHFSFFGYSSIAAIFAILLVVLLKKENKFIKIIFQNRGLKSMGKISFSLYVLHWPILVLFKLYLRSYLTTVGISEQYSYMMISILAMIFAIIMSIFSYHFFEKKFLNLKTVLTTEGFAEKAYQKLLSMLGLNYPGSR